MEVTNDWLVSQSPCSAGYKWYRRSKLTDLFEIIDKLQTENHFDWANWLIVRKMTYNQCVSYAIFTAECVIDVYETKYPDNKFPRNAIEAAKKCLNNPTTENKKAAGAGAAGAAYAGAGAAADAAYAAAGAAGAAYAAAGAAGAAARREMQSKILNYGIDLLKSEGIEK